MAKEISSNNKRIAKNTVFLYARMLFVLIVSLYTSRVVLNTLGVEGYGTFNVVAGFVSMFGFLNATLSSSMQRFYNYEGTRDRINGYRKVYFTGLIIHVALGLILLLLLETFGLWYVNTIMVVPVEKLLAVNVVYQSSIISVIFVIFQTPYTGALMADERMEYYAIISILDVFLKLAAVISLPFLPYDKLIVYGLLLLSITLFDFFAYFIYAKKTVLNFPIKFRIDLPLFKSIMSFSGWNMVGTFAFLLKGQGLNMLLNVFFGTVINAARGIAYQVNTAITGFSSNISLVFRPQVVNAYAECDYSRCTKLVFTESKICYCLLYVLITPVAIEIDYLLHLWLGESVPDYTNVFAILVLLDSLVCTLNTPITQIAFATGKIKKYQIYSSAVNLLLLPVCYVFLTMGCDAVIVFAITIVFSIINQVACMSALKSSFKFSALDYLKSVVLPCMLTTVLIPILPISVKYYLQPSFGRLILVGITSLIIFMPIAYYLVLNANERIYLHKFLKRK